MLLRGLHGCPATYCETIHVVETFQGEPVWEEVYVFDLDGHDLACVA